MNFTEPTRPRARKEHRCSVCFRRIDPGEVYYRTRGYDAGDAWTFRQCVHCQAITALYDPRDQDSLISEDGHGAWTEDRPRDWTEARHMASWRMSWRTKDGTLLPIPTLSEDTP